MKYKKFGRYRYRLASEGTSSKGIARERKLLRSIGYSSKVTRKNGNVYVWMRKRR